MELLKIIIVIILPPLGVFLQVGIGKHFWLNLVLTLLGYIPGIVHGVWVIAKTNDRSNCRSKRNNLSGSGYDRIIPIFLQMGG